MSSETICVLFSHFGMIISEDIKKFCDVNELYEYFTLSKLSSSNFVSDCDNFYKTKTGKTSGLSPGNKAKLNYVGQEISKLSLEAFNEIISPPGPQIDFDDTEMSSLLQEFIKQSQKGKKAKFDGILRDFAILIRILAGRNAYVILQSNLPLPSVSTVDAWIRCENYIEEGVLQVRFVSVFVNIFHVLSQFTFLMETGYFNRFVVCRLQVIKIHRMLP